MRIALTTPSLGPANLLALWVLDRALARTGRPPRREAARALAARVGAEDGVGATVALLERASR